MAKTERKWRSAEERKVESNARAVKTLLGEKGIKASLSAILDAMGDYESPHEIQVSEWVKDKDFVSSLPERLRGAGRGSPQKDAVRQFLADTYPSWRGQPYEARILACLADRLLPFVRGEGKVGRKARRDKVISDWRREFAKSR